MTLLSGQTTKYLLTIRAEAKGYAAKWYNLHCCWSLGVAEEAGEMSGLSPGERKEEARNPCEEQRGNGVVAGGSDKKPKERLEHEEPGLHHPQTSDRH